MTDTPKTEPAKAEPKAATKRYVALTPINHDGKDVAQGKTLALTDEAAEALLACTPPAIELAGKKAEAETE